MKTTLRILTGIIGSLLLATGLTLPAHAAAAPELPPYACQPHRPAPRDFTCDGNPDLLVRDSHDNLWIYPGDGDGGFLPRIKSGTGWHFTTITPTHVGGAYGGVFARDKSGTLWFYPSNGHAGWLKPTRLGDGWNQMTSIIDETAHFNLLAIDRSGALWRYPYGATPDHAPVLLPRQRVGHGWAGYMLVAMKIGTSYPDFYARDAHGVLWPYYDNGKGIRRGAHSFGAGWGAYTRIISDGDFENVDGYLDLVATDAHGYLWFYPSTMGGTSIGHRVMIGHGWTGYTVY